MRIFGHVAEGTSVPSLDQHGVAEMATSVRSEVRQIPKISFTQTVGCCTGVISSIQRNSLTSGFVAITC